VRRWGTNSVSASTVVVTAAPHSNLGALLKQLLKSEECVTGVVRVLSGGTFSFTQFHSMNVRRSYTLKSTLAVGLHLLEITFIRGSNEESN
jgi:hypothetical protein